MVGLNAFTNSILSIIEKTSYFMKARARRLRSDPYSKDRMVNLLIISVSVKYSSTWTI